MKSKKGISLIVLVITIIVMTVLAGAIILSLNNSGIIQKANQAVNKTNEATVKELAQMAWAEAYADGVRSIVDLEDGTKGFQSRVNEVLEANGVDTEEYVVTATLQGVNITLASQEPWVLDREELNVTKGRAELKIGQTVKYTATGTDYKGEWKVLGVDDKGNLLIMSASDVKTGFSPYTESTTLATAQNTWLSGGVNKLNSECAAYGKGTYAIGARSITVEDIDKITGYEKTTYASSSIYKYGNEVTYTYNGTTKPDYSGSNGVTGTLTTDHTKGFYWYDEEGFHSVTADELTAEENKGKTIATITSDYYYYLGTSKLSADSDAYKMIFGTSDSYNSYWLASPYVLTNPTDVGIGLRDVYGGSVIQQRFVEFCG